MRVRMEPDAESGIGASGGIDDWSGVQCAPAELAHGMGAVWECGRATCPGSPGCSWTCTWPGTGTGRSGCGGVEVDGEDAFLELWGCMFLFVLVLVLGVYVINIVLLLC